MAEKNNTLSDIKLGTQGVQSGAYQFIPVPFVDDWLLSRQRKAMATSALEKSGISFDPDVPRILAGGSTSLWSRVASVAKGAVQKPLRKIFRTFFFWLTARRAAITALETYFFGRLLVHPKVSELAAGSHLTEDSAKRLVEAFEKATKNVDLKALSSLVSFVNPLLRRPKNDPPSGTEIRETIEKSKPRMITAFEESISKSLSDS